MSEEREIIEIEHFCKQLYESQDPNIRQKAEKIVVTFQNSPDTLGKCQALLERADSSYAQLLAATTLTKLVSSPTTALTLQQRLDIRNYVLNYLATRPKLAPFVTQALVTLFARITKISWFDVIKEECVFRNVLTDITKFLQGPVEHCIVGVQLLSQLTCEMTQMSQTEVNRSLAKHRKTASSFRDTQLLEVFRLACSLLSSARVENLDLANEAQHNLMSALLRLLLNCLTYDFIGGGSDESADDQCTVQIPANWRPTFLEMSTLELFFELYAALPASLSSIALSCLVQLASVRRSLFNNDERAKFLNRLVTGVRGILESAQGLSDTNNYHEFCRLLARLKSNYQLAELVNVDNYPQFIQLIAKFTVQSLQLYQFANSVHYLLSLWQRMVVSVPYVKNSSPHFLETYAPGVVAAYVTSRLESVAPALRDEIEDPLEDLGMVNQQLEQISIIARCSYTETCTVLINHFENIAARYTTASSDIPLLQGQLTWLVYIIGAAIAGRASSNNDDNDSMDGELVCRVLTLMSLSDARLQQGNGCERLELAMMSFLEQFRRMYVTENMYKNSKLYRRLADVLNIADETALLAVFMRKIITNLKYWCGSERIICKSLGLLSDLSGGYSSVRKLVKLEEVKFMLTHHTVEHFPFLGTNISLLEMRRRTMLYTALGRLLMVELGEDEDRFHTFMMPLTAMFERVKGLLGAPEGAIYASDETKKCIIGLARDLRGLVFAFNTKSTYMMLFNWIYPLYLSVLSRGVEVWYGDPALTTPVLKFVAELAQNRNQRLLFDSSCPNGYLLFREVSKFICTYGNRILTVEADKKEIYAQKLKGISLCFSILRSALCGNYVNFGVFRLYGDDALDNALNMFIKLLLSIPKSDIMDYPKLSQTYYVLLDRLALDHMQFLASLQPEPLLYILATLSDGLTSLGKISKRFEPTICTGCCTTLDYVVTHLFNQQMALENNKLSGQPDSMYVEIVQRRPEILEQLLSMILNIVINEECNNQWCMSRPLLGLALIVGGGCPLRALRNAAPAQESLAVPLAALTNGVQRTLFTSNRDRFTQNLSMFRRDINESLKGTNNGSGGGATNDMMTS